MVGENNATERENQNSVIHIRNAWKILPSLWLLPGLVLSTVLGNQPSEDVQLIGQAVAWLNMLAATLVLWKTVRHKLWIVILVICIIISKILRIVTMSSSADIAYLIFFNFLFCSAGAVVLFQMPNRIYKQLMIICLLNLLFMVFQVTGLGAWSQVFTTHGEGSMTEPVSTLFVPEYNIDYLVIQGRPAGLSYSNIILCLILLFALVLHFSRTKGKVWWGTIVLSSMIVLAMSKLVFFGFILIFLCLMIMGSAKQKYAIFKAFTLTVILFLLYWLLFPGLAAFNLSSDTISTSIFLRLNDIVNAISQDNQMRDFLDVYLEGTAQFTWGEEGDFVSGYAKLVKNLPMILPIMAAGAGIFIIGMLKLKKTDPELTAKVILAILVVGIYPVAFPCWGVQLYWFIAGLGLLPFYCLLRFRFLHTAKRY